MTLQPELKQTQRVTARSGRRGVILLFVVVLLTLLAVLGSAYLVTAKLDAGGVSPEARGGPADTFNPELRDPVASTVKSVELAAQRAIFGDAFELETAPFGRGVARRVNRLLWRPTREQVGGPTGIPGVFNLENPAVYAPMAAYGVAEQFLNTTLSAGTQFVSPFGRGGATVLRDDMNVATPTIRVPYYAVDAEGGTDPWMSSRTVRLDGTVTPKQFVWSWVSAPLAGVFDFPVDNIFYDPFTAALAVDFDASTTEDLRRANLIPTFRGPVVTPAPADVRVYPGTSGEYYNDRTRVYPALANAAGNLITAADADGDGVADAGLVPFVVDNTQDVGDRARYVDPATGLVYLYAVRIVDNNAAVNVNTALTNFGDYNLNNNFDNFAQSGVITSGGNRGKSSGVVPFDFNNAFLAPNWGIYPTNVGLLQLFDSAEDGDMYDYPTPPAKPQIKAAANTNQAVPAGYGYADNFTGRTREAQFLEFFPARMGGRNLLPLNDGTLVDVNNDNVGDAGSSPRTDTGYGTLGELVTMSQSRLLQPVGVDEPMLPTYFNFTAGTNGPRTDPFRDADSTASLLYHGGGWVRPNAAVSPLERVLYDGLVTWAGNYVPNPRLAFDFMPIGGDVGTGSTNIRDADSAYGLRALWTTLFKTADPDALTFFNRANDVGITSFRGKTGDFPISPRNGLVTRNGVTQVFTPKLLAVGGGDASVLRRQFSVPFGMPAYNDATFNNDPTPVLVNANADADRTRANNVVPPVKAGANTSPFNELWRAYFNVMAANAPGLVNSDGPGFATVTARDAGFDAPPAPAAAGGGADVFDPKPLVDHAANGLPAAYALSREQVLLLRSAMSAVNTMDIRDIDRVDAVRVPVPGDNDVTVAEVDLGAVNNPATAAAAKQHVVARVYGTEAQPFIDEVLIDVDAAGNVTAISLELFNPYPFPINMEGWRLAAVDRTTAVGTPPQAATLVTLTTFAADDGTGLIPATDLGGKPAQVGPPATAAVAPTFSPGLMYVQSTNAPMGVVAPTDNSTVDPPAGGAPRVAVSSGAGKSPTVITLAGLSDTAGLRELVLVRPPRNDLNETDRGTLYGVDDYVPLDGVDFRGVTQATAGDSRIRYARRTAGSTGADASVTRDWDYVYGGPWATATATATDPVRPASTGTVNIVGATDPGYGGEFGKINATFTDSAPASQAVPIQVGPVLSGPWRDRGHTRPTYPYGGFARDGDVLGVPLIGGYRLAFVDETGAETVADFVSVGLDAAFAGAADSLESSAGHFYEHVVAAAPDNWAADFLDYFAALNTPGQDRFPQADPRYENVGTAAAPRYNDTTLYARGNVTAGPPVWSNALIGLATFSGADATQTVRLFDTPTAAQRAQQPSPLIGFDFGSNDYDEAFTPVEGLVNLNTADAGILKTLPLDVDLKTGTVPANKTATGANALITNRQTSGPLKSVLGLSGIGSDPFNTAIQTSAANANAQPAAGDITGRIRVDDDPLDEANNFYDTYQTATDGDFEQSTQVLTRLSNLTTTRSDSFTVYVVVQAWRLPDTAATPNVPARLMRQQRSAFVVDRSNLQPFNRDTGEQWAPDDLNGEGFKSALRVTPIPVE